MRNGTDFWWDEWSGNTANCWFDNRGFDGAKGSITGPGPAGGMPGSPPQVLPDCSGGQNPSSSTGGGDPAKTIYLVNCSEGPGDNDTGEAPNCDWYSPPAKPGSRAARRDAAAFAAKAAAYNRSAAGRNVLERMKALTAGADG
jgi:hypothetical protein